MRHLSEVFSATAISNIKKQRSMREFGVSTNKRRVRIEVVYHHNGKFNGVYESLNQASKELGINVRHLSNAVHNGRVVSNEYGLEYDVRAI